MEDGEEIEIGGTVQEEARKLSQSTVAPALWKKYRVM
jgi:hypothetical protein